MNNNGMWRTFMQAQLTKNTFVGILFSNKGGVTIFLENIDRAHSHTLATLTDPDTFVHIDFHAYKLTHT
jgi:hypothetical protein